ncbi:MAG TPA: LytR C-terminal domain-containing protein [Solirubrobacteraceae bacterium]|nr:LytR C-terminal domain-containing protein [Solirubrobacteraceae bacterium]
MRATRPDQTIPPRDAPRQPAEQGSHRGLLAVVLGGIAIAAVAVLLITQVFSGDDTPTTTRPNSVGTPTTPADTGGGGTAAKPQPARGTTRVAVFNGTTVTGLARAAADKLTAAGYKNVSPVTTDTTNQSRATTVVYWQSGSRREGVDVAKLIGVGKTALQPMDQNARVLGGGAPVVVIVGADQAQ